MNVSTPEALRQSSCKPCEGGVEKMSVDEAKRQISQLADWKLSDQGDEISRDWQRSDFKDALAFVERIGELAETEQHHPDLHLTSYRKVRVVLKTHAIGGLSENDFILAAKIDELS